MDLAIFATAWTATRNKTQWARWARGISRGVSRAAVGNAIRRCRSPAVAGHGRTQEVAARTNQWIPAALNGSRSLPLGGYVRRKRHLAMQIDLGGLGFEERGH